MSSRRSSRRVSGRLAARSARHQRSYTRRRPFRTLEMWSLVTVTTLLVAYGGVAIATVLQRPPRSPVTLTLLRWQQFADSCVGTFVARSAVTHPIALELTVTDRKGSTEITPEERVGQVEVGHTVHFTAYE